MKEDSRKAGVGGTGWGSGVKFSHRSGGEEEWGVKAEERCAVGREFEGTAWGPEERWPGEECGGPWYCQLVGEGELSCLQESPLTSCFFWAEVLRACGCCYFRGRSFRSF